jgi:hypothetical protein
MFDGLDGVFGINAIRLFGLSSHDRRYGFGISGTAFHPIWHDGRHWCCKTGLKTMISLDMTDEFWSWTGVAGT